MKQFFLIHGAWHDERCWSGVKENLEQLDFKVHTITIAGNEPDSISIKTSYKEMVDSVVEKAKSIDGKFILVAHSSAGHIVQHAAPKFPDKIEKIVFNNAWLLPDNTSQFDLVPSEIKNGMRARAENHPQNCIPLDKNFFYNMLANNTKTKIQEDLLSILVPQPITIMETKSQTKRFADLDIPMVLLHCKNDISLPPNTYKNMFLGQNKGDKIVEIEGVHECLFTDPELFTKGLMKCV